MNLGMDKDRKKMLLMALNLILAIPVLVVGIGSALILQFVGHGNFLGFVLILVLAVVVLAGNVLFAKKIADEIQKFFINMTEIADGTISIENHELAGHAKSNEKINEMLHSINDMVVSYAKIITSIKNATEELGEVSESFTDLFGRMTDAEGEVSGRVDSISENVISQAVRSDRFPTM